MTRIEDLSASELSQLKDMEKDFTRFYTDRSQLSDEATVEYIELLYEHAGYQYKPVVLFAEDPATDYRLKWQLMQDHGPVGDAIMNLFEVRNGLSGKNPSDYPTNLSDVVGWDRWLSDAAVMKEIKPKAKQYDQRSYFAFMCSAYTRAYLGWFYFLKTVRGEDVDHWDFLQKAYPLSLKTDVCRAFFAEEVVLVLRLPKRMHVQGGLIQGETLHNVEGPAIEYPDTKFYFVNGREVEEKYFTQEITFEMFKNCDNEDEKAAMVDIVRNRKGDEGLLDFLRAECVDEKVIEHFPGYQETVRLYKTKERYGHLNDHLGNTNQPYCWTSIVCPSTGANYLIDNSAAFDDAEEALKFLRPTFVPKELTYRWADFAN